MGKIVPADDELLYKIELVFPGGDGGHRLEVTMEVALVKKAAVERGFGYVSSLLKEQAGFFDSAVHAILMGCQSICSLETAKKGKGIAC